MKEFSEFTEKYLAVYVTVVVILSAFIIYSLVSWSLKHRFNPKDFRSIARDKNFAFYNICKNEKNCLSLLPSTMTGNDMYKLGVEKYKQ